MLGQIFRESGGALYHLKALRYGHLWGQFRRELEAWLNTWNPPRQQLLLLGASAGYSLTTDWLKTFPHVVAVDLDPVAPMIFRRRHPGVNVEFISLDLFWKDDQLSTDNLKSLLAKHPQATVLFSNVIGQILLEGEATDDKWFAFLNDLRHTLQSRHWASYHDTYSQNRGVVIDHMTSGNWTSGLATLEMEWPLTHQRRHRIQAVHHSP